MKVCRITEKTGAAFIETNPFALQVEGALIDEESHPNHAAGTIWDVIELDKAVGVAHRWSRTHAQYPTLVLVTADHDQSMSILGVADISDRDLTGRTPVVTQRGTYYRDSIVNLRSGLGLANLPPEIAKSGDRAGFPDYQDADGDGYRKIAKLTARGVNGLPLRFEPEGTPAVRFPLLRKVQGRCYSQAILIRPRFSSASHRHSSALDQALEEPLRQSR